MNLMTIIIRSYCFLNGYSVKSLTSKADLEAYFELRNKINYELNNLPPLPLDKEIVNLKGTTYCIGIFKNKRLIGGVRLIDLSQMEPYVSRNFHGQVFNHNPQKTYEVKGLMVDLPFQSANSMIFKILMYYCMEFTEKSGRECWLVGTSKSMYGMVKRVGLPTKWISDKLVFLNDGSVQARYCANYKDSNNPTDPYCCFYMNFPKGIRQQLFKKYLKNMFRVYFKRIKRRRLSSI